MNSLVILFLFSRHRLMQRLKTIILLLALCHMFICYSQSEGEGKDALAAFQFRRARELYEASQYDSAAIYYSLALNHYRNINQQEMEIRCLEGLAEVYRIGNDFNRCETYLDEAGQMINSNPDHKAELDAELLFIKGKLAHDRGNYGESVGILKRSVELMDSSGADPRRLARAINFLGNAYYMSGDLDRAEQSYRRFLEIISGMPGRPLIEEAWYHTNMAIIDNDRGNYPSAVEHNKISCQVQKVVYGDRYPELGDAYYNMARAYFIIGSFDTVAAYLDTVEVYYSRYFPEDQVRSAKGYILRGSIEYGKGNYLNARRYYERSWNLLSGQLAPSHNIMTSLYINLGNIFSVLKDYDRALYYYNLLAEQAATLHPSKAINAYLYLATTQARLGHKDQGGQYFRKLIHARTGYYGVHNIPLAQDYFIYADFLADIGELDSSFSYCRKALAIRTDILGAGSQYTADCYRLLGDIWYKAGSADSALYYYQETLHSLSNRYDRANILSNPLPGEVSHRLLYARTMKGKAEALQKLADRENGRRNKYLAAALSCYEQIFPVMDDLRNTSMTDEGRLFIGDNERNTYNRAVELALSLYEETGDRIYLNKSFLIAEKAKYTTLLMAVRNNNALSFSHVPAAMLTELQDVKNRTSSYRDLIREEELSGNPDEKKLRLWQEELYSLEDREGKFVGELEKNYPDYYQLKYNTSVIAPEEILASLHRKDRLIEYYLTPDALVVFVLSGRDVTVKKHLIDSTFLAKMDTLRRFCYENTLISYRKGQVDSFRRISSELYDLLIRPCDVHGGERLIIIPDAAMNYLPFDVLMSGNSFSSIYYKDYPFLLKSNPVIYSYSATLFMNYRSGRPSKRGGLLAMAPSYDSGSKGTLTGTRELVINRRELEPLQGTLEEITGIQKITGGRAVLGYEASEHLFKQLAPDCRILHMAMHAFIDDADPLYSKLVFSDNTEGGEDGFLNAYEIYNLDLHARMVVLSACQTGAGIVRMGEGIMSLARAFYYSGVPDVVMSLWAVSDTSGRKLMVDFYDRLSHGLDKGKAMQKAKINYLESAEPLRQQPYYWAGYIVTGDPSPVFVPRRKWLFMTGVALLILLVTAMMSRKYLKGIKRSPGGPMS